MAQELLSGTLETAIRAELAALDAASTSLAAFHDGSGVPQKRALQQELMGGGGLLMAGATGRKRAWQAGLTAVRRSSGGAGVASVNLRQVMGLVMGGAGVPLSLAHVLPKGDFMDLAAAASPTVRRLLAPVRGADTRAAVGQREAEQRGAGGGDADGDKQRAAVSGACDTLLGLRTSLLLLLHLRAAAVKLSRRRSLAGLQRAYAALRTWAEEWRRRRRGGALLLARVRRRVLARCLRGWLGRLEQAKGHLRKVARALGRRTRRLARAKAVVVRGWRARAARLAFRVRQVWGARHRRALRVAIEVMAAWKALYAAAFVRARGVWAMRGRRQLQLLSLRFLDWKYAAAARAAPSSSALKVMYVCMYVYIYVCLCVCMYAYISLYIYIHISCIHQWIGPQGNGGRCVTTTVTVMVVSVVHMRRADELVQQLCQATYRVDSTYIVRRCAGDSWRMPRVSGARLF